MELYTDNNKVEIEILQVLKKIKDPEIAINIVDLGLIYKIVYTNEIRQIQIVMTLSSKGCPMGELIMSQVKDLTEEHYQGCSVQIDLVWEPLWSADFITPAGKKELGML